MCTVTWLLTADGYEVFCNRDERRTRAAAWPPRVRERQGVRFIAPIDGDGGGTWIGVNQFGLTLSLLNRYEANTSALPAEPLSRGWLVLELLASRNVTEVQQRLSAQHLPSFAPFTLLTLAPPGCASLFAWDGLTLHAETDAAARLPLTSSSFATRAVVAARQAQFAQVGAPLSRAALAAFHRSHEPEPGAFSVCMHRDNAQTVSYSHLCVTAQSATFTYLPHAPCAATGAASYATRLELSAA